jgi:hypothetical protein
MPKKAEAALKRAASKRGYGEKRANAYVYGTLRKTGWKPGHQGAYKNDMIDHSPKIVIHHKD